MNLDNPFAPFLLFCLLGLFGIISPALVAVWLFIFRYIKEKFLNYGMPCCHSEIKTQYRVCSICGRCCCSDCSAVAEKDEYTIACFKCLKELK